MSEQSCVVGWKEVRNQELADILTRRVEVGFLTAQVARSMTRRWAEDGLLPSEGSWQPAELAAVVEEWLDARALTPRSLQEIAQRWTNARLLPAQTRDWTGADYDGVLQHALFQRFATLLQPHTLREEAAALQAGATEKEDHLVVDERAGQDLAEELRRRRAANLAAFLDECRNNGLIALPFLTAPQSAAEESGGSGMKSREEDEEHIRYGQTAAAEWGGEASPAPRKEALILGALLLEALMRRELSTDLVGLALSGGGIRSASFNLGLLQSLHASNLLRDVDYLSTVSGGGYVGSLLSSMVHKQDVHMNPARGKELPFAPAADGKQPERVKKLVRSGSYINRPGVHASRYLFGVLLNNLVFVSSLLALCTLLALAWRGLDMYPVAEWLRYATGEFIIDWNRPFLPAAALFLLWLVVSGVSLALVGGQAQPRITRFLLLGVGLCLLIGAAVCLATPYLDVPLTRTPAPGTKLSLVSLENYPLMILLAVVLIGVLPFLRPGRFLASGTQPDSGKLERLAFRVLGLALIAGIPFFTIYLLARHDIAAELSIFAAKPDSKARDRDDVSSRRWRLHETDLHFQRWGDFWKRLKKEATAENTVGYHTWKRLEKVHAEIDATLEDSLLEAIQSAPIVLPKDEEASKKKTTVINAFNASVLGDPSFADDILKRAPENIRAADTLAYIVKRAAMMREQQRLLSMLERYRQNRLIDSDLKHLNRLLLEAYYGWAIWERAIVRRSLVINQDQHFRVGVLLAALSVALVGSLIVSLNATSLHGIYRHQLARVYLEPVGEDKPDIPLHELDTTSKGAPYHILSGTLNKGREQRQDTRPTAHFLFSRRFCGSTITGFVPSEQYLGGKLDLATAMAISGAAFSPVRMGNQLIAVLMIILNVRLGQWLPSPRHPARVRWLPMLRLASSLTFRRGMDQRRYWFISDGGHNENLGLGPLLRRECRLIIVSDAGYDPDYGFDDFVQVYRHARLQGVRFQTLDQRGFIRLDPLMPDKATGNSPHRYVIARVEYPGPQGKWGLLIYLKPSFTGDEAVDLARYRRLNAAFPHDPTANQWFDEDQVESYRELGAWIGQRACEALAEFFRKRRDRAADLTRLVEELQIELEHRDRLPGRTDANVVPAQRPEVRVQSGGGEERALPT